MKNKFLVLLLLPFIFFNFIPAPIHDAMHTEAGSTGTKALRPARDTVSDRVKIRLFAEATPDYTIFTVTAGQYLISDGNGNSFTPKLWNPVAILRINNKVYAKERNGKSIAGDSINIKGLTGEDCFSLRIAEENLPKRNYSGDLKCFSDLETLMLINSCDVEKYIAGVVKSEGGSGKNEEYFKTQAIIARTYTYKYLNKHIIDRYNLCDDTHCQAFNGLTSDSVIINSVKDTRGLVLTTPDSLLIISAFHSNCGGETAPSQQAWMTSQPYLKKVADPYCSSSRNAKWEERLSFREWSDFLKKNGMQNMPADSSGFNFVQKTRVSDYVAGSFTLPLRTIRSGLELRSTFFSVRVYGDSVLLDGRGYGHGVGLCQEGAMVMAQKGFTCQRIIDFYYSGVLIMDIKNAVLLPAAIAKTDL